jgi:peptidase E
MAGEKTIVALGGGGFLMEPENPLLDQYVLGLTGRPRPRACFLGQAGGDSDAYVARFIDAFRRYPCEPSNLSLFKPHTADLRGFLLSQDLIYVGGGNTKSMLALWREWGLDLILREAWEKGIVLAGVSAGAICWFEQGITDSIPGPLTPISCLGFLAGSCCPHYDGEAARRPSFTRLITERKLTPGLAADDGAAMRFRDRELVEVVTSRPAPVAAYRVGISGEERIPVRYLG